MRYVLFIKSDNEDVFVSINDDTKELACKQWQAGRELSAQLLSTINELCDSVKIKMDQLSGVVVYSGPGSYTGLRISISVVNALGYSLGVPVAGSSGKNWQTQGIKQLAEFKEFKPISPVYGADVYTTKPKK